jgi:Holliday junction resolvasome RuvABC ATP-dependent DNA helicase subunit
VKVKSDNQIIRDGITEPDLKILRYLAQFEKGLGKNTIANYLRVKSQTYEYEYEPYLVFKELVIVDSRRKITAKGKEFLNEIKS